MSSDTQLDSEVLRLFEAEAAEHLHALNSGLLELEQDGTPSADTLAGMLRAAHTLKGTAAAAGVSAVEALLHLFESCAQALSGHVGAAPEALDLLFRLLDAAESEVGFVCTGVRAGVAASVPTEAELRRVFGDQLDVSLVRAVNEHAQAPVADARRTSDGAIVRIATRKIDRLMANVEELVQVKAGAVERQRELGRITGALEGMSKLLARLVREQAVRGRQGNDGARQLAQQLSELKDQADELATSGGRVQAELRRHTHLLSGLSTSLQDDIRSVRMVPAEAAFSSFARLVRDVGRRLDKSVALEIDGGDTEVDRDLIDALKDPIMHLLRNAVGHGIESAEQRALAHKPAQGTVRLCVRSAAAGLEIDVEDDGHGIDTAVIRSTLVARAAYTAEAAAALSDAELQAWLFRPGFSTSDAIDAVSGRGVGLDVVHNAVEACGGSIQVSSQPGAGTRFRLRLPLNLTTVRALRVRVAGQVLALPVSGVARVVRVERNAVRLVNAGPAIELEGRAVPLSRLSAVLRMADEASVFQRAPAVIVGFGSEQIGLVVDAIEGEDELIVKSLGEHLRETPYVTGAAVLANGTIVPVLGVSGLLRQLVASPSGEEVFAPAAVTKTVRKRVLIVDDSITTRTLERSILEAVGYEVEVATDGQDALNKLRGARFDLMLSDVQMPRVDGIELVTRARRDDSLRALKIVLVSSLNGDEDRRRGLTAGADAYLGKTEFRQDVLLETLERLL